MPCYRALLALASPGTRFSIASELPTRLRDSIMPRSPATGRAEKALFSMPFGTGGKTRGSIRRSRGANSQNQLPACDRDPRPLAPISRPLSSALRAEEVPRQTGIQRILGTCVSTKHAISPGIQNARRRYGLPGIAGRNSIFSPGIAAEPNARSRRLP